MQICEPIGIGPPPALIHNQYSAVEALAMGFVDTVVPADRLDAEMTC
jgi:1,4-dihydroxy-2-naphthoyl-CoA synthase